MAEELLKKVVSSYSVNRSSHLGFEELCDLAVRRTSLSATSSTYTAVPNQFFFLLSLAQDTDGGAQGHTG